MGTNPSQKSRIGRTNWSWSFPHHGSWKSSFEESAGEKIDLKFLMQFPEFVEFRKVARQGNKTEAAGEISDESGLTPEEALENSYQRLRRTLAQELLERIKGCSPSFFERLVVDLLVPSLCTTCYRVGRTGHDFTDKATSGEMEKFCQANAVLNLKEYLLDYCVNGSKDAVAKAIEKGLDEVKDAGVKKALIEKLKELEEGKRDLYF